MYSGSPGIVLFYNQLFKAAGDSVYLKEALGGADFLSSQLEDSIYGPMEVGLYTGLAGIGYTLYEIYKTTDIPKYKKGVLKSIELLQSSAETTGEGIHWDFLSDIVYGSAGIGLYLQYIADELDSDRADSMVISVAHGLMDLSYPYSDHLRWKFHPESESFMDNFSHGTAGVAYFLAETYKRTRDEQFLHAALQGTRLLDSVANEKGYVPHHLPGGEELYYLNWCHGPAGISRLYYSLYDVTKDQEWLDKITFVADHLLLEEIDQTEKPGYWNNVGKCCGDVSIAEYYQWLYDLSGKSKYKEFSTIMTKKILNKATIQDDFMKWIHAENRKSPEDQAAQSGLMQGTAGMGLWFLHLYGMEQAGNYSIQLPDYPVIK